MASRHCILLLVLFSYLAFGVGFAFFTPQWQNPDEPAHYNYIRHLGETGRIPVLQLEDYNHVYLEEIVRRGFPPDLDISPLRYEYHQPPLYYLLALPVYAISQGRVLPLRFFSLILGAGLIVVAYLVVRTVVPGQQSIACSAAAFVAFLPQHTAMMASINNDALAELLMGLVLWLALRERLRLSSGLWERTLLGLAVGLSLLTKLTVAIGYPLAAFALLRRLQDERHLHLHPERMHRSTTNQRIDLLLVLVLPLLIVLPWWLRNLSVYGMPDFLGLVRHAAAVAAQPQTVDWIGIHGFSSWLCRLFTFTFQSFWGQFGWMAVPMRPVVYQAILLFCALITASWLLARFRAATGRASDTMGKATTLLIVSTGLTLLAYLGYNYSYVQHQGRYLYSAIVPICLAMAFGWERLLVQIGDRFSSFSFPVLYVLLVCLNLYALFGVVRPHGW